METTDRVDRVRTHPDTTGPQASIAEAKKSVKVVSTGSVVEGLGGLGAVVLAILGLAGVLPGVLAFIATIAIGAALLFEGAAIASRFSSLLSGLSGGRAESVQLGGGMTAEFLGGAAGVVLGILALVGVEPMVLLPVAAIVYGGAVVFGTGATSRLNALEMARNEYDTYQQAAGREAVSAAASMQVFVGLGSITLGILALIGVAAPLTLVLVAMLALGTSELLSGAAITSRMISIFHP